MERAFRWSPPAAAPAAVQRPRLLQPLARRFEVRLVVIEAGAGFGKTTLLAQAIAENRLRPAGTLRRWRAGLRDLVSADSEPQLR